MTRFRKLTKATTLALAIAAGFGVSGAAHASLVATAVLEVQNFQIQSVASGVGTILDASHFSGLTVGDFGHNTASLTGSTSVTTSGSVASGPMNIAQACVGVICPGQDVYTHTTPPPVVNTQLARADSNLQGAPLTGLGQPTGATAQTVAEVLLTSNGVGGGDSGLGLNTLFNLVLTGTETLRLDFLADLYLRTFLSADSQIPGSVARASSALSFGIDQLVGGAFVNVFQWAPDGVVGSGIVGGIENFDGTNLNTGITTLLPGTTTANDLAGSQHFQADVTLGAGVYQFAINHAVFANGTQVIPEPGTMLLAGVGLLGVALSRRRASKAA